MQCIILPTILQKKPCIQQLLVPGWHLTRFKVIDTYTHTSHDYWYKMPIKINIQKHMPIHFTHLQSSYSIYFSATSLQQTITALYFPKCQGEYLHNPCVNIWSCAAYWQTCQKSHVCINKYGLNKLQFNKWFSDFTTCTGYFVRYWFPSGVC